MTAFIVTESPTIPSHLMFQKCHFRYVIGFLLRRPLKDDIWLVGLNRAVLFQESLAVHKAQILMSRGVCVVTQARCH